LVVAALAASAERRPVLLRVVVLMRVMRKRSKLIAGSLEIVFFLKGVTKGL
jgi:hypothetical protein